MNKKIIYGVILVLIGLAFLARFMVIGQPGHAGDFSTLFGWLYDSHDDFFNFYEKTSSNYGPLYPILTRELVHPVNFISRYIDHVQAGWIVERLVLILADGVLSYLLFKLIAPKFGGLKAYLAVLLYLINPIIFASAGFWGQSDNIILIFLILSFGLLVKDKILEAFLVAGGSLLFKPSLIVIMPFFFFTFLLNKKYKDLLMSILILGIAFYLLGAIFFGFSPVDVYKYYFETLLQNNLTPRMAVGARSFWFWFGEFASDDLKIIGISAHMWGSAMLLFVNLLGAWIFYKYKNLSSLAIAFLIILFGFYFLPTRSHERYQLFSFLPLMILVATQKKVWITLSFYLISSITFGYTILAMVPFYKMQFFDSLLGNKNLSDLIVGVNLILMIATLIFACYYPKQSYGKNNKEI